MGARTHVRWVAAMWLTCQIAAVAAAPFVLCHDHAMTGVPAEHECGQYCPMHPRQEQPSAEASHQHHHHSTESSSTDSTGAALSCRCTVSDAALAGLTLDAGILPPVVSLVDELFSPRVVMSDYAAPTRDQLPETPPPRA